jgi:hypothetical protein
MFEIICFDYCILFVNIYLVKKESESTRINLEKCSNEFFRNGLMN